MFKARFSDKDFGFANWDKGLRFLGGKQSDLEVGLLEGHASAEAIRKGALNEIGTAHVPARPWFRHTIDANREKYLRYLQRRFLKALQDGKSTDVTLKSELGAIVAKDLTRAILSGPWESNAARTIRKKGFNWPLVETGELSQSVSWRIVPRKGAVK